MNNREAFELLLAKGVIDVKRGGLFDDAPAPPGPGFSWDKVEGMMLALAIGDSLGITTEGQLPAERRRAHGEIRDYLPNRHVKSAPGRLVHGYPSDDTQLAFWTLDQMVEDRGLVPERVARRFTRERIYGLGSAVRAFLADLRSGKAWFLCGQPSAGNGALMRIAPVLIPHLRAPSTSLWADAALGAFLTHNDTASIAACLSFVGMLWDLLGMSAPPGPDWWVSRFARTAADVETTTVYTPRGGAFMGWQGPLSRFVLEKITSARERKLGVLEAGEKWHSGAFLLETVPCALYILAKHAHDPEEALVRAVNDTRDNDTIAAIVGAAVGALHGRRALPSRWVERLSGRTSDRDDGKVFEILARARELWDPQRGDGV